jgi:hypothetical protein
MFGVMSNIAPEVIAGTPSDDDLFAVIGSELERLLPNGRRADDEFVAELRNLPPGLRAMAATYELDVSLTLDDLGWHFGNWHHMSLAEETAAGLEELGATELADLFRKAFLLARDFWGELGSEHWSKWYHGSALEKAVTPLNVKAWAILDTKQMGLFSYWLEYARQFPERLQEGGADR